MPRGDKPTTVALALKDGWIYEDALPESMTREQYDWWFRESLVLDGVRMGPPLTTRNTTDNEPGEALACCLCSKPLTTLPNETAYCRNLKPNPSSFDDWKANSCPMARQSTCLPIVVWKALNASRAPLAAVGGDALRNLLNQFLLDKYGCTIEHHRMKVLKHFVEWAGSAAAASSLPAELPPNHPFIVLSQDLFDALTTASHELKAAVEIGAANPIYAQALTIVDTMLKHDAHRLTAPTEPLQPEGEQEREVQCADCLTWFKPDTNHTCRQQVRRNQRSAK